MKQVQVKLDHYVAALRTQRDNALEDAARQSAIADSLRDENAQLKAKIEALEKEGAA